MRRVCLLVLALSGLLTRRMAFAFLLCAALLSSGCWGLLLSQNPKPFGRNHGKVSVGVVILDLLLTPFCIGIVIDACAGTLREHDPYYSPPRRSEAAIPGKMRLRVSQADIDAHGNRAIRVVWRSADGSTQELYSGLVRNATGVEVNVQGSGFGRLEMLVDGEARASLAVRVAPNPVRVCIAK